MPASILDLKHAASDAHEFARRGDDFACGSMAIIGAALCCGSLALHVEIGLASIAPKHVWSYHDNQAKRVRQPGERPARRIVADEASAKRTNCRKNLDVPAHADDAGSCC
jgi:hypothetical protein